MPRSNKLFVVHPSVSMLMHALTQLERWMQVTYFCQHCGYEFADRPKLPTKCPRCKKTLRNFDKPIIALKKRR